MFLKNSMRPALAGVSASGQAPRRARKNDAFMYDSGTSETDDFGSFSSGNSARAPRKNSGKPQNKFNAKAIAIAAVAVVALVLLVVLVVSVAGSSSGDIKYDDNAFVVYKDISESWCVSANGDIIGTYDDEVDLIVAKDRSFAYIVEETEEGYTVYVTDGKDAEKITEKPITKVLATSGLSAGVVWLTEDKGIYVWNEKYGEERIINSDKVVNTLVNVDNSFIISDDGLTVAYLRLDDGVQNIYTYTHSDFSVKVGRTSGAFPAALSSDGSLLYYYGKTADADAQTLRVLSVENPDDRCDVASDFTSIVAMNVAGDELVYTSTSSSSNGTPVISTNVVKVNIKKATTSSAVTVYKGFVYEPMSYDPEVAVLATFGNAYFKVADSELIDMIERTDGKVYLYRLAKNYYKDSTPDKISRVSSFSGKFDPDGDYYYFINSKNTLCRVDLKDLEEDAVEIASDIVDFEITKKGNLYWLEDTETLKYHKVSSEKSTRIAEDVDSIFMHDYSNTLYFTYSSDDTSDNETYCTKEGSKRELAKFGKANTTGLPYFTSTSSKHAYAAFYNDETNEWSLYYTSNGKSFKGIGNCQISYEMFDISISDMLEIFIDSITPDDTTPDTSGDTSET